MNLRPYISYTLKHMQLDTKIICYVFKLSIPIFLFLFMNHLKKTSSYLEAELTG